jgi:hypothetical protein
LSKLAAKSSASSSPAAVRTATSLGNGEPTQTMAEASRLGLHPSCSKSWPISANSAWQRTLLSQPLATIRLASC